MEVDNLHMLTTTLCNEGAMGKPNSKVYYELLEDLQFL